MDASRNTPAPLAGGDRGGAFHIGNVEFTKNPTAAQGPGALEAALTLAATGLPVFPCRADKRPACPRGFKSASRDPTAIGDLWRRYPGQLIGVPTGEVSGFDALDIDPRHGGDAWLETNRPHLPVTRTHKTKSGGQHLLFTHHQGLRNSAGRIAPGVDVRADGGYIVWWVAAGLPVLSDAPNADWPDWLVELARRPTALPTAGGAVAPYAAAALASELAALRVTPEGGRNDALNVAALRLGHLVGSGALDEPATRAALESAGLELGLSEREVRATVKSGLNAGMAEPSAIPAGARVLSAGDPLGSARLFLASSYTADGHRTLHHHDGAFCEWDGTRYRLADENTIRAEVYAFLEKSHALRDGKILPFCPTQHKVSGVIDALRAAAHVTGTVAMPSWLPGAHEPCPPPGELVACKNGLLHLPTLKLHPHSSSFFNANSLDYDYSPAAPVPEEWLKFLRELWPDDPESIAVLQFIFGLLLASETKYQKIALIVGPKRSGKGTIARILTALLGRENVVAPTLAGLSTNFGLAPLIGKLLAIIADARLGGRADQAVIAERLLSISGEDAQTIDRKYLPPWTGRLPTRFLILTNELPRLADASGALASRFIVLTLTNSFLGREDHALTDKLLAELPAILNWSIRGWQRLQRRGYLIQPKSSADAIEQLEDLGSPIGAFLKMCVDSEPGAEVTRAALYRAYADWNASEGRNFPGNAATFGRDLRAAYPDLQTHKRTVGGVQTRVYAGIKLKSPALPGAKY